MLEEVMAVPQDAARWSQALSLILRGCNQNGIGGLSKHRGLVQTLDDAGHSCIRPRQLRVQPINVLLCMGISLPHPLMTR
jgi:hypothetical protein